MNGFSKAMQEYEMHRDCPYDFGGALFDYEEYANKLEELEDDKGNMMYDMMKEQQ